MIEVFGTDYDTPDGTGVRDYIHVDDLATAHLEGMEYILKHDDNLLVNLGTGRGASVIEMIRAAEKMTGRKIKHEPVGRREGDPSQVYADPTLAKKLLDWEAQHSDLETIFKSMIPVYLK